GHADFAVGNVRVGFSRVHPAVLKPWQVGIGVGQIDYLVPIDNFLRAHWLGIFAIALLARRVNLARAELAVNQAIESRNAVRRGAHRRKDLPALGDLGGSLRPLLAVPSIEETNVVPLGAAERGVEARDVVWSL